jgi:hypothetical protein
MLARYLWAVPLRLLEPAASLLPHEDSGEADTQVCEEPRSSRRESEKRGGKAAGAATVAARPSAARGLRLSKRGQSSGPAAAGAATTEDVLVPHVSRAPYPQDGLVAQTLLALFAVSSAFFLLSYQVHEKSVLLPLMPMALLVRRWPAVATWYSAVAVWSMWPLLAKDGLLLPAVLLTALYAGAVAVTTSGTQFADEAAEVACALPAAVAASLGLQGAEAAGRRRWVLRGAIGASALAAAALSVAAWAVPPPASLPDVHPYASSVYAAGCFAAAYGLACGAQWRLLYGEYGGAKAD